MKTPSGDCSLRLCMVAFPFSHETKKLPTAIAAGVPSYRCKPVSSKESWIPACAGMTILYATCLRDTTLASQKSGWPLFEKRLDAFRVIVGEPRAADREDFHLEQHFERRHVHRLEHFLGQHQRVGRRLRQLERQRLRRGLEFAVGHHFHDDAHLLRFSGGKLARGIHELLGARDAEMLREQEYCAAVGRQAGFLE